MKSTNHFVFVTLLIGSIMTSNAANVISITQTGSGNNKAHVTQKGSMGDVIVQQTGHNNTLVQ